MAELTEDETLLSINIKVNPRLFEGKRHSTNREIANILAEYAKEHKGFVGDLISLIAQYHELVELVSKAAQDATGSLSTSVGCCGTCSVDGGKGQPFLVSGQLQKCFPCEGPC